MHEIQKNGFFIHNYGLILDGETVPVSLRATLVREDAREMIVLGVSKVNAEESQDNQAKMPREYSMSAMPNRGTPAEENMFLP